MQYRDSIFTSLLKPIDRRAFKAVVARHRGDAYDKTFGSWKHLVALIFAQLSGIDSLRGLVAGFNANAHHHYHLGVSRLARSTLADANARRPLGVFADTFAMLSARIDRKTRGEGQTMLRLIDATPVPLGALFDFARWNGRIRGLKLHLVYDPEAECPRTIAITPATVNDIEIGRQTPIERGATYVFDKAYCHYGWWTDLAEAGAFFVTRPKKNAPLRTVQERPLEAQQARGDGFTVLSDHAVTFAGKDPKKLPIRLRLIEVARDDAKAITLITNDLERPAATIAALYKARWQIELLFRWIKQHLNIKTFIGTSENAVKLQLLAAMIAFALLRLAARWHRLALPALRLAELAGACLFIRKPLARIDKPPPVNPSRPRPKTSPNQIEFAYA